MTGHYLDETHLRSAGRGCATLCAKTMHSPRIRTNRTTGHNSAVNQRRRAGEAERHYKRALHLCNALRTNSAGQIVGVTHRKLACGGPATQSTIISTSSPGHNSNGRLSCR